MQTKSLQAVTKHLALLEAANLVSTVTWARETVPLDEIYDRWIGKHERSSPASAERSLRRGINA